MYRNPADHLYKTVSGPFAVVRLCLICKHGETVPRGAFGRGHGLREGNKARGRMIQHIKASHPNELKNFIKENSK